MTPCYATAELIAAVEGKAAVVIAVAAAVVAVCLLCLKLMKVH